MKNLASVFLLAACGLAAEPAWASRLIISPDASAAWLLNAQGVVSRVDLREGRAAPFTGMSQLDPGAAVADIALSSDGTTLFALTPVAEGRTTILRSLDTATGQERAHWEVRGQGRFLVVPAGGARACIVGRKPAGAGHRRNDAGDHDGDWTLIVVDLTTGKQTPPVSPGLTPVAVALMETTGSSPKVLLAARDRVATYGLDPLRVSWFYKSPGENNDVAVPAGSPVVCLLRGSSLAIIDPSRRPTEAGRVQLGEDDATAVVALPARGRALAVSRDGRTATVLHDDSGSITLVDLSAGRTLSTHKLTAPRDLLASQMSEGGGQDKVAVTLASSIDPGGGVETLQADAAPPAPPGAEVAPPPPARPEPAKPVPEEKFELKVIVPEPPGSGPAGIPPEQLAAPPKDPTPPEAKPARTEAPASPPPPAPVLPPRPAAGASLQGRLTGDLAQAREVLFYGPGNIIKLHARAKVEADGTFILPLPPAGSYRVVVSAGAGAHIFTRPEFRTVTVAADAGGLEGIDFEVRGAIK